MKGDMGSIKYRCCLFYLKIMRKFITCFLLMTALSTNSAYCADNADIKANINKSIENREEYVFLGDKQLSDEELVKTMCEYFAEYSNAGLIDASVSFFDEDENGFTDTIGLNYRYSEEETAQILKDIEKKETALARYVGGKPNEEKVQLVYSYFCRNFSYDDELNYDLKHLYEEKSGTCCSFTLAFKAVMDRLDIPCKVVVSDDLTHEWNKVFINNEWLNVDITDGIRLYQTGFPNAHLRTFLESDEVYKARGYKENT